MERDDVIEYSLNAQHSEEEGKKLRKKIWQVAGILTLLTTVEVLLGVIASGWVGVKWEVVKYSFIVMTAIKAGYIVFSFMHLGDERKFFKYTIIIPYIAFICYLILICLFEGNALS